MKKCKPYIGITGVMSEKEAVTLAKSIPGETDRLFMVGTLASSKTLDDEKNKWPGRYPLRENIASIFQDNQQCLNLIHYSTDDPSTLLWQLRNLRQFGGKYLDGFQLNMLWPPTADLGGYLALYPDTNIVLQIGKKAFQTMNNSPANLAKMCKKYRDFIDYILLDPSGGLGQAFDPKIARDYLTALQDLNICGFGVAGGLCVQTLNLVDELLVDFPHLSIDAESKLRTPQPEDALDLKSAIAYLKKSYEMVSRMG